MTIDFRQVHSAAIDDMIRLYRDAGWWDRNCEQNPGFLKGVVSGSACFVGAFDGDTMIGMGRALSDGVSDAYIQDVVVLQAYRGKGIGREIISALVRALQSKGVDWIGLIGEPGTSAFYEKLGFSPMKNHIPYKYRD